MDEQIGSRDDFSYYWNLSEDFIERINKRNSGWSGVVLSYDRNLASDSPVDRIFIKKQEDYISYSFPHFIRGVLTIENELRILLYCRRHGIVTPELVYSGKRMVYGRRQAILVTRCLEGFSSLRDILYKDKNGLFSEGRFRRVMISKIADEVRRLHEIRITHNNLYPKHIFVDFESLKVAFIDFERSRKKISSRLCMLRDLSVLNRYTPSVSKTDKLRFLKAYCSSDSVNLEVRKIWKKLTE